MGARLYFVNENVVGSIQCTGFLGMDVHERSCHEQAAGYCSRSPGGILRTQPHPTVVAVRLGAQRPGCDVDLLVEFEPDHVPGLIALGGMEIELSELLGRKVDLRTAGELSRFFRDEVVRTGEPQYEKC